MHTIPPPPRDLSWWRNALGLLAAPVIALFVLIALVLKIATMPFERPIGRKAAEVAAYLRDFLNSAGGEWDWDDFTSIPIADPRLESIRAEAEMIQLPLSDAGRGRAIG